MEGVLYASPLPSFSAVAPPQRNSLTATWFLQEVAMGRDRTYFPGDGYVSSEAIKKTAGGRGKKAYNLGLRVCQSRGSMRARARAHTRAHAQPPRLSVGHLWTLRALAAILHQYHVTTFLESGSRKLQLPTAIS